MFLRIKQIITLIHDLIKIGYPSYSFSISYLTIFSQSEEDYKNLTNELKKLGEEEPANNGVKYKLHTPIKEAGEEISLIRIRRPDVHRHELGCADLKYKPEDYEKLRTIALERGFDIIVRKDYEMIEISDFHINVYAYLVKKLLIATLMTKLRTIFGDITKLKVDCIVNAANSQLAGGGGVDFAIHKTAGPKLYGIGRNIIKTKYPEGLPVGEAVITDGFNLPAKYVIHTVGPIWYGGKDNEAEKLYNCYINSLKLAMENKIKSIAFPAISTGVFGYPQEQAKVIAEKAVKDFISQYPDDLEEIIFVIHKR